MSGGLDRGAPPKVLSWLLARAVPQDIRDGIVGDMEETYRRYRPRYGPVWSGLWYAGQTLMLGVRFLPARIAEAPGRRLGISWLDMKLGLRMLRKHPGLNAAGGAALAITIAFGAGLYEFFGEFISIELPFPEGDRVVRVTNWDTEAGEAETRSVADFAIWREVVESVAPMAAFTRSEANVASPGGVPVPTRGARTSAAMFEILRVPPLLGRPLLPTDEAEDAPPVVVVSHDLWDGQLGGPPLSDLVLEIGGVEHEVVGVMPAGFRFPIDQRWWAPLRIPATGLGPRTGVSIWAFGRLAPATTQEAAQAEFTLLGQRSADQWPETHVRLEPRVTRFWESPGGGWQRWVALGLQSAFGFLLALAAVNVAILSFSRTASRQGEISVRTALGASRSRIVSQLVSEALVLSMVAAGAALVIAALVVPKASELFWRAQGMDVPYWVDPGLEPGTAIYAFLLAMLGAGIAGVLPALKVTGKRVGEGLRNVTLGGSALHFGRLPTAVVVIQVALAVAFLPFPASHALARVQREPVVNALDGDRILTARLQADSETGAAGEGMSPEAVLRFEERLQELEERLAAHPQVQAVTFAESLPGQGHRYRQVVVDGADDPSEEGTGARTTAVRPGYVDALGVRVAAGRALRLADVADDAGPMVALVNEAFVEQALGGGNALGQRLRFVQPEDSGPGPWVEIVGVVENLNVDPGGSGIEGTDLRPDAAVYLPSAVGELSRVRIAVRLAGPAAAFGPELRRAAATVDPRMRVDDVVALDQVARSAAASDRMLLALSVTIALLVAGLAVGGVYTLMSFIVEQRTREIGIRIALGSSTAELLRTIFTRAGMQLTLGVAVGLGILALFLRDATVSAVSVAAATSILVLAAGLLACALPSRRALRLQPTEDLRSD